LENFLKEIVDMGFTKDQGQAAMKAAFNNPERAMDYLLNVKDNYINVKGMPSQPQVPLGGTGVVNPPPMPPG
jgi:UV excision repair protein RAD23